MLISVVFFVCCIASALTGTEGTALSSCARNYDKIGCYDEYNASVKDLLVYDRYGIQWTNIVAYMHHLACTCEAKARDVNKGRSEADRYFGFAIHFWGECYGRTQAQLDSLASRSKSARCTGDQTYTKCYDKNPECAGHAFSEFVFGLRPGEGDVRITRACSLSTVTLDCPAPSRVHIKQANYGKRTPYICGAPLSDGWNANCTRLSLPTANRYFNRCATKSSCTIDDWMKDEYDPCPSVKKYADFYYKCEI